MPDLISTGKLCCIPRTLRLRKGPACQQHDYMAMLYQGPYQLSCVGEQCCRQALQVPPYQLVQGKAWEPCLVCCVQLCYNDSCHSS
jgi:hypothetical protein